MLYNFIDISLTIDSHMWFKDKKVVELERNIYFWAHSHSQFDLKHKTTGSSEKSAYAINSSYREIEMNEWMPKPIYYTIQKSNLFIAYVVYYL